MKRKVIAKKSIWFVVVMLISNFIFTIATNLCLFSYIDLEKIVFIILGVLCFGLWIFTLIIGCEALIVPINRIERDNKNIYINGIFKEKIVSYASIKDLKYKCIFKDSIGTIIIYTDEKKYKIKYLKNVKEVEENIKA